MHRDDVDRAILFFAASAGSYSVAQIATALGWIVQRAQEVLNTLERRWIIQRRQSSLNDRRPMYRYIPQEAGPPPGA
jgi:DNA-binding MarR family transcriptional regulator